jgi:dTDP-4-amino-4,6-dideoxygalactose transaminase
MDSGEFHAMHSQTAEFDVKKKDSAEPTDRTRARNFALDTSGREGDGKIAYLENKRPNRRRVTEFLRASQQKNHWANGGPVSRRLEETIAKITGLSPAKTVVACCSGTAALNALAGVHAIKQGRPVRWVVSAYSFFSCFIGPFAESITVDCDGEGMLDLAALSSLSPDLYDGVCVTNLFGLHPDLQRYEEFCWEREKVLIVDNAQGFFRVDRSRREGPDEMISFHHTKPWGFGEGGCAIISNEDEHLVRSIINFGVSLSPSAAPSFFNGKMSDVAAAYILDRLENMEQWLSRYEKQWRRIAGAVRRAHLDLKLFPRSGDRFAGIGHIPILASRPIRAEELENDCFVMRKYYRPPPEPNLIRAQDIFARIINIPCHTEMAAVPANALTRVLTRILKD